MSRALLQTDKISTLYKYPRTCTPKAVVTQTADTWDSGAGAKYVSLATDSVRLNVYVDKSAYLVTSDSTAAPAQNGCLFAAGNYEFEVFGPYYLHVRNGTAGQNVSTYVTCWVP